MGAKVEVYGISAEVNDRLALRAEGTKGMLEEECIPKKLEVGQRYAFMKRGRHNLSMISEIPLVETAGGEQLSSPLATIRIVEETHLLIDGTIRTKGICEVYEVYGCERTA